ncbi:hypothetical protein Tco_0663286 [Tanacetum coccineum]
MIMPSKDKMYNGKKGIGFENPSYFGKAKELRPSLYDERVIGLGYTLMFLTHSDEALEIEKFKRARENKIEFAYDYGNLNESYVNEKINFSDDYFQEIINPDFEKIDSPFQQTSSLKPYVPTVILEKIIIDLEDEVVSLLEKEKENLEIIESLKSKGFESSENAISESENQSENDCQVVEKGCENLENSIVIAPRILYASYDVNDLFVFDDIVQICLWIINSGCSKHMTGNRALLTNLVEKFLGTVHFGNNDFAVITGYGDVVIGSMTIKKVYYVEGLGHNLFSIGEFCDKGLEVAFRKSTCFVRNEDGVDLLTGDRSSNLYTIALNEIASNSLACLLAKASSQSCVVKAIGDIGDCLLEILKESVAFRVYNKRTRKIHESVNVNFDEISEMGFKQFNLEPGLSNLNKTGKSSNPTVSKVLESSKKDLEDLFHNFYDEYFEASKITKSPTMNVETSNDEIPSHEEEVFHESSKSFPEESSSSSLNADVQQSSEEVTVPSSNTQSISNSMVPNVNEAMQCQVELDQFTRLKYGRLDSVEPKGPIRISKNKKDESNLVIKTKTRLVAVGYYQQEGID